ncbi:CBS domain-containing protein [Flavonifractor plautii]|nr:CBS domain-containing protein [Flavonifractor plautii]
MKDIMTRNCAVVSPDDDAREATRLMAAKQVRRLPVLEGARWWGWSLWGSGPVPPV